MFAYSMVVQYSYLLIAAPLVVVFVIILIITTLTLKNWLEQKAEFNFAQQRDWKNTHRQIGRASCRERV